MNEEQEVLDFFSRGENLSLALSVAELVDHQRQQLNNRFWMALADRISADATNWQVETTGDRDADERLVGIHLRPKLEQQLYLSPILEQQNMGGKPRIYFGLMWSEIPTFDKSNLDAVNTLRNAMQTKGYKNNERFLAWRWSTLHPASKSFLLRFATQPDVLLDETRHLFMPLLHTFGAALTNANAALRESPHSTSISLDNLRSGASRP